MKRKENREALMKWFYECDMKEELGLLSEYPHKEAIAKKKPEARYAQALTSAFAEHQEQIEAIISSSAAHWRIERIGKVELAILRLAATELLHLGDIPVPVIVSEALELAQKYASDESKPFLNGVLGKIADERE